MHKGAFVHESLEEKTSEEKNEESLNDDREREIGVPEEEEIDSIDYDDDNEHLDVEEQGSEEE
jgi:hypothetical protein